MTIHPAGDASREGSARPDTDQWNVTVRFELGLECDSFTEMVYCNTTTHSEFRVAEVSRIGRRL